MPRSEKLDYGTFGQNHPEIRATLKTLDLVEEARHGNTGAVKSTSFFRCCV